METRVFGLLQTQTDRLLKAITKSNAVNYPVTLLLFFLLFRGGALGSYFTADASCSALDNGAAV